jgi:Predicted permease
MELIINFFKRPFVRRLLILALIALLLYLMRSMMTLFLLTFIFIYLINTAQQFIYRHIRKYIPVRRSFIIVCIYCVIVAVIVLILCVYAHQIVNQTVAVVKFMIEEVSALMNIKSTGNDALDMLLNEIRKIDFKSYAESGGKYIVSFIGNIGALSAYFFLSIILSLFFMLQKGRIYALMRNFKTSKLAPIYQEVSFFGKKFLNTFGKVLQTQILISFINALLSIVLLSIMRFPNVLGLGMMVFLLGIIPVAGVFISLIPLSVVAYTVGGWNYIIYVIILIAVLHALEGYVLNPKLMSDKTNLPIFFTFLILTVSSHFFGIWGLLVGIPVFVFILDILDVKIPNMKMPLPSASDIKSKLEKKPKEEKNDGPDSR